MSQIHAVNLILMFFIMMTTISLIMLHTTSDDFPSVPISVGGQSMKRLFPTKKYRTYDILKIELEQTGLPNSAIIQTFHPRREQYELWSLLPFSVSPPPDVIYKSPYPFNWTTNAALNVIIIGEHHQKLLIYEKTDIGKGTLGSWHHRQSFRIDMLGAKPEDNPLRLSMTSNEKTIFAANNFCIYALFEMGQKPVSYLFQRMMMDQTKIDFMTFPHSIHYDLELLVIASPNFRQTDGVVDVYRFPQKSFDLYSISLFQTLPPPSRAGYFGGHCALTPHPLLLVSSRFAADAKGRHGAGAVYVYQFTDNKFRVRQILTCPDQFSPAETHTLNFGQVFDISVNGQWLAISSHSHAQGRVYVFEQNPQSRLYERRHTLLCDSPRPQRFGKSMSIDNQGTILIADDHNVYFSFMRMRPQDDPIVVRPFVPQKSPRLRDYSPSRYTHALKKRSKSRRRNKTKTHTRQKTVGGSLTPTRFGRRRAITQ